MVSQRNLGLRRIELRRRQSKLVHDGQIRSQRAKNKSAHPIKMKKKLLLLLFSVILTSWLGFKFYEGYEIERLSANITHHLARFPELQGLKAERSKPGLISIKGRLKSKSDFDLLVREAQNIMNHQLIVKPAISFAVHYDQVMPPAVTPEIHPDRL